MLKSLSEALSAKKKHFATSQEGFHKNMECAFRVLLSRCSLLKRGCRFGDLQTIRETMQAAIILYYMIAELRRDKYVSKIKNNSLLTIWCDALLQAGRRQRKFILNICASAILDAQ